MKIIIQGTPGEGKSVLALVVAEALIKAGIDVTVEDDDVLDLDRALSSPMLPVALQVLRMREGFHALVRTERVPEDAKELLQMQKARLQAYARALDIEFQDKQRLVEEWGAEEWEGTECAVFAKSSSVPGVMLGYLTDDGTIRLVTSFAGADDYRDEDKYVDVLPAEIERATRRRHQLHATPD